MARASRSAVAAIGLRAPSAGTAPGGQVHRRINFDNVWTALARASTDSALLRLRDRADQPASNQSAVYSGASEASGSGDRIVMCRVFLTHVFTVREARKVPSQLPRAEKTNA